jgi:hypothetical protein
MLVAAWRLYNFRDHLRVTLHPRLIEVKSNHSQDDHETSRHGQDLSAIPSLGKRGEQRRRRVVLRNSFQHAALQVLEERFIELGRLGCVQPPLALLVLVSEPVASTAPFKMRLDPICGARAEVAFDVKRY